MEKWITPTRQKSRENHNFPSNGMFYCACATSPDAISLSLSLFLAFYVFNDFEVELLILRTSAIFGMYSIGWSIIGSQQQMYCSMHTKSIFIHTVEYSKRSIVRDMNWIWHVFLLLYAYNYVRTHNQNFHSLTINYLWLNEFLMATRAGCFVYFVSLLLLDEAVQKKLNHAYQCQYLCEMSIHQWVPSGSSAKKKKCSMNVSIVISDDGSKQCVYVLIYASSHVKYPQANTQKEWKKKSLMKWKVNKVIFFFFLWMFIFSLRPIHELLKICFAYTLQMPES